MSSDLARPTVERGLWAETWRVITLNIKNILIYACFMLAIAALPELLTEDGEMGGVLVAQSIAVALLAIPSHLTVLRNNPAIDVVARKAMMSFVWRGIVLGGMSFLPSLAIMIFLVVRLGHGVFLATIETLLIWLVVGSAAFAKWGTVLPAVITGNTKSFSRAGQRGSLTFGYSFPRLLLSFGLFTFVQFIVLLGILTIFESSGRFFPGDGGIDIPLWFSAIVATLIGAIGLVMTAVILSRAFLLAEARTSQMAEPGQPFQTAHADPQ
jgi:hypothetical protein